VDPRHLLAELLTAPRGRQGQLAQVELDVEVRVVGPVRAAEAERNLDEPLAHHRHQVQPLLVDRPDGVEPPPLGGGGQVDDHQAADVAHGRGRLDVEELRVERGELSHVVSLAPATKARSRTGERLDVTPTSRRPRPPDYQGMSEFSYFPRHACRGK